MNNTNDTIFDRYLTLSALLEEFVYVGILFERMVCPVWYFIGFLTNPVSAIIWFGRRMRRNNSSAIYLGSLAVSDFFFLILHFFHYLQYSWGFKIFNVPSGCEPFMLFYYIPQYFSVILVAGFTVERYTAVCHPFLKEKWCTVKRACCLVACFLVFSTALASVQIFIWTYDPTVDMCNTRPEAKGKVEGEGFSHNWKWTIDILIFGILPLIVLLFNCLVLREIIKLSQNGVITRQQNRSGGSNNTASTLTLLSVSFYLIVTQLAATVVSNIEALFHYGEIDLTDDEVRRDPKWCKLFSYLEARKIVEVICLSHFACYFFIYVLTGKHFRREVLYLLSCNGRISFLSSLLGRTHKGERYSMVTSNGHSLATDTCTTTFTTNI